jgi:hypothetical protein
MSDFRDRFGLQLAAASAELLAAGEGDFRARFGAQLTRAAGELAAARRPLAEPARRERRHRAPQMPRPGFPKLRRPFAPGLSLLDFRGRFGFQLTRAAGELAAEHEPFAAPASRERTTRRPHLRLPRLSRPIVLGLSLTAFAGTAVAATIILWTPQLGNPNYGGPHPQASADVPPAAELNALGVLRRAANPATDRGALTERALTFVNAYTRTVETNYVRLLASDGSGGGFVLVPAQRLTAGFSGAPAHSGTGATTLANALCVYAEKTGFVAVNCFTFEQVLAGAARTVFADQVFGLAPDSASTATITFANGVETTAPVTSNLFNVALPPGATGAPTVTFSGATATS